jgi:membrane protein DedA with SNARE-associated domain
VQDPAAFLARWHYLGLFAVILAEEAGVPLPIPGDLFIAAMGFLASTGRGSFLPTVAVVTGATVLGAGFLFLVSRHAAGRLLAWASRWFGFDATRAARLEGWLHRRGAWAVVLGRLVPGLRIVMTVVAGALRLPQPTFALGTLVAGALWATIYFWLGWLLGAGYQRLAGEGAVPHWALVAGAGALAAAAFILLLLRGRRRRAAPPAP